ncbi:MAG: M23 family metallopeptidase [Bacteroidales bacterium]|nr:M23 family metallopeptidase [Bacteroidales bacterium]MDD3200812.1 M23 family metallopeptidase [Bacteroidales bacterium]
MFGEKKYIFNKETLSYEVANVSVKGRLIRTLAFIAVSVGVFLGYYLLYTRVLGLETPKAVILERKNKELLSNMEAFNQKMDENDRILLEIQMRDNIVYRPIFGMDEIPSDIRNAGFGGVDRYDYLEHYENSDFLVASAMRFDILSKKAYIQSRSFDDVSILAKRAGDMASCIPTIFPVMPVVHNHLSSSFGYRTDPFTGFAKMHTGIDISGPNSEPIYATGDGIVVDVSYNFFGYGNNVIIDHGFGYKTRYAHLKEATVKLGQMVKRGEQIGKMGSTGRSKGTHLHYEVIYKDRPINPWNYFNNDMTSEEYQKLIISGKSKG